MARLPEDKPSLAHRVADYDPAKAHEYYMRTRKLHPRRKGSAVQPTATRRGGARLVSAPKPTPQVELRKQRANAAAQVASLQKKLSQLNEALKKALKQEAEAKKGPKKPTAADKSKKARESKKYRQEHKQELKTKAKQAAAKSGGGKEKGTTTTKKSGAGSSASIKAAIAGVQRALAAAKARQRALG